jgi:hypothetical protein
MSQVEAKINSKLSGFKSSGSNDTINSDTINISPNVTYSTPNLNELGFEIDHSGNKLICNKNIEFKNAYDTIPEGTIIMWDKDNIGPLPTSCWTEVINLNGRIPMGAGGLPRFNIKFKNTDTKIPFRSHVHSISSDGEHDHDTRWFIDDNPVEGMKCDNYHNISTKTTGGEDECPVGMGKHTDHEQYNLGMRMVHIDKNGTHTHTISSSGRDDGDNWTTNNLPPIYGVKFFKKQKCT